MYPKQFSCDQKLPRLVTNNPESNTQIVYTLDNGHHRYECQIPELHGRRIHACFHEWVILSNHPDNVLWSLWNPVTSKLIRLPPLPRKEKDSYDCCLSSPPDAQGSVFLLFSCAIPTIVFCQLDPKRKRLKWIEMSYAKQLKSISGEDDCILTDPTCYNGKVYAMTLSYFFIVEVEIVVKNKEVVITLLPFVEAPQISCDPCPYHNGFCTVYDFLKGTCVGLFYIQVDFKDEMMKTVGDVCLFKLDMTSMTWKETVDLKDAIFFLDFTDDDCATCYYSSVVNSELGGYIHIFCELSKIIHSACVKDRTVSLSSMSFLVRESEESAWAMLDWRLEADHALEEQDKDTAIVVRPETSVYDSTTSESHLLNMPLHILGMIMEFCIGVEYMKFRATCKHCYLAAPSIQWSNTACLTRMRNYSLISPWLMVLDNCRNTITFIDPICGERYFIKTPQELIDGYRIYCSRYGWLLMYKVRDAKRLVLFNPFTSNIIELPEVHYLESFCFSAPPTSPDCIVVGFTSYGPFHVYIHLVSRESRWRRYGLNFGDVDPYSYHFPTFSGRDIYALCNNERIEAFEDVSNDDYSWEAVADKGPITRCRSPTQYFMSKCDQHLLLVIVGELGESVEVHKLNESTQEWEKIDWLGKHIIYISSTSCICLEAISPEMGNKIYFPRLLHGEDAKIVFYSLETCRYHTFHDKNIQESFGVDLFGTKHHCYPHTWIEPSWS